MDHVTRQQTELLQPFVLRARRIAAHSLAADRNALRTFATGSMKIEFRPAEGKTFITQTMPPEEQLESAAARVRPLILQTDSTYLDKVLKAIAFLVREDDELARRTRLIRDDWKKLNNPKVAAGSYARVMDERGIESDSLSDVELAHAYIYGDVVHHDTKRLAETAAFGVRARYQAAAVIVPRLMLQALATFDVIMRARSRKLILLPEELFTSEVVATETTIRREAEVHVAEAGTEPPGSMTEPFGAGWAKVDPRNPKL